jgi:hypothetical protein
MQPADVPQQCISDSVPNISSLRNIMSMPHICSTGNHLVFNTESSAFVSTSSAEYKLHVPCTRDNLKAVKITRIHGWAIPESDIRTEFMCT